MLRFTFKDGIIKTKCYPLERKHPKKTSSTEKVMRVEKMVTKGKMLRSVIKVISTPFKVMLINNNKNNNLFTLRSIYTTIYLSGFLKTWLKKFQVDFNYLTSVWNRKQFKVTSGS